MPILKGEYSELSDSFSPLHCCLSYWSLYTVIIVECLGFTQINETQGLN